MGLLNTFLGNADQTQALGLLGAQMMAGNTPGGLLGATQFLGQADERKLRQDLVRAQLAETYAQAEQRKMAVEAARRSQERQDNFLYGDPNAPPASASIPGPGGMGPTAPQGQGGGLIARARQFGIPDDVIQADIAFNGGKKISEILNSRSAPKWENVNGNLVNTNAPGFGGGFQPGFSVSSNGQAMAWQPDGRGGLVFGAPPGALPTYNAYQRISEGAKADFDPLTVTPRGQPPQMTTRGAFVRGQEKITPEQQAAMDRDRKGILEQELSKAQAQLQAALRVGDQSAAARAQTDIASVTRELGGKAPTVGMALESPEEKLRAEEGVKGDAKANEARAKDVKTAKNFLRMADQAELLLQAGPTASGLGSMTDATAAFFGQSTKGAELAQQLKAIGGWLVSNVPRMEGPQSNFDVGNYQTMAADVGNDRLPIERRIAALRSIKQMFSSVISGPSEPTKPGPALPVTPTSSGGQGGWSIQRM